MVRKVKIVILCLLMSISVSACSVSTMAENTDVASSKDSLDTVQQAGATSENGVDEFGWYDSATLSNRGFDWWHDMIHIPDGGSFYYDRYTHIVWLCKTRYSMMPYIGPHGHYCKYNPDTKIMSEIMEAEK